MAIDSGQAKTTEPGLAALVMSLGFHGVGADGDQIRHQVGAAAIGVPEMLRCAKDFGLKARARKSAWHRLAGTPMPVIAALSDGGFLILGKVADEKVLV